MEFKLPKEGYTGVVREIVIGKGDKTLKIGGENILPFHYFDEGKAPNPPRFALEVLDMEPHDWPDFLREPFGENLKDPVAWAKRCEEYGADAICLTLVSTDPAEKDTPPDVAVNLVQRLLSELKKPLIVYGCGDEKKDSEVLAKVAEACNGENLLIGPVQKENYEILGKAILDNGHAAIAQSPLDINLLKELNIKLCKTLPPERVVIDPLSSALGYGIEYSFSIMERVKQIGIITKDTMTMMPLIANLGGECWKTKQAKENKTQGILWEGITAITLLLAGANLLVLRHPETLKLVKETLGGNKVWN
ncbi:MAG: acetyl-CoA decarbonylase/synthase complex subunit delta [Desulfobacterota bacterium]|nr:acetyl-CoA decarbonylase/synthase complex subunit delta [Thermodesulfobacteriota bacterium]MDW8002456.1 acetyl-CoA decarbonylase/synthase complex subunit delta [Deltaproteobacteria bacterium]